MSPYLDDGDLAIYVGDAGTVLPELPEASVDCVVTSPPYYSLRDYGQEGQIGAEDTPEEYVARLVGVFREVRRVLAPHGVAWLNLGDSYASDYKGSGGRSPKQTTNTGSFYAPRRLDHGVKPKDLIGVPWRVALALQDAGWWLRSDVIWAKPNPMPESITDRPTRSHEYLFLLTKSARYFWDAEAVREPWSDHRNGASGAKVSKFSDPSARRNDGGVTSAPGTSGRNVRSVWTIATQPYAEAHFATFPEELARRAILAGCPEGGTVLDPFLGSGTTALVARNLSRRCVGIELSPDYAELAAKRTRQLSLMGGSA